VPIHAAASWTPSAWNDPRKAGCLSIVAVAAARNLATVLPRTQPSRTTWTASSGSCSSSDGVDACGRMGEASSDAVNYYEALITVADGYPTSPRSRSQAACVICISGFVASSTSHRSGSAADCSRNPRRTRRWNSMSSRSGNRALRLLPPRSPHHPHRLPSRGGARKRRLRAPRERHCGRECTRDPAEHRGHRRSHHRRQRTHSGRIAAATAARPPSARPPASAAA
jgi:hypothetical protein